MKRQSIEPGIRNIATLGLPDDVRDEAERICRGTTAKRTDGAVPCVDKHFHHLCLQCERLAREACAAS